MTTPASPRPPILDAEIQRWVLTSATELRSLRASLSDAVGALPGVAGGASDDSLEKMLIVATELVTNALKYGLPPTIVRFCSNGQDYIIDVVDHDPTTQPENGRQHQPTSGGLGLILARALALDVDWYITPTTKHVWARFGTASAD